MYIGTIIRQKQASKIYKSQEAFNEDLYKDRGEDIKRVALSWLGGGAAGGMVGGMAGAAINKNLVPASALGGILGGAYLASKYMRDRQIKEEEKRNNIARALYLKQPLINKGFVSGVLGSMVTDSILSAGVDKPSLGGSLRAIGVTALLTPEIEKRMLAKDLYRQHVAGF